MMTIKIANFNSLVRVRHSRVWNLKAGVPGVPGAFLYPRWLGMAGSTTTLKILKIPANYSTVLIGAFEMDESRCARAEWRW